MNPPKVCCCECGQLMVEVSHKLVPIEIVKAWAIRAGGILPTDGWFMCEPCDVWFHLNTMENTPRVC